MATVAITLGDPRGIGPEVVKKALEKPPAGVRILAVGPNELVDALPVEGIGIGSLNEKEEASESAPPPASAVRADPFFSEPETGSPSPGSAGPVDPFFDKTPTESPSGAPEGAVDPRFMKPPTRSPLTVAGAGRLAGLAVERAVSMAMQGEVDAIVTAPADKYALNLAGYKYPGHTEWLAELAGGVEVAMMLVADRLRVVLVTTHIPLREVPNAVTVDKIVTVGQVCRREFRKRFGIAEPRFAVCALNPHAGDSGLFGSEDDKIIRPAAEQLGAVGPVPADTVFVRCMKGEFDAVLAPYHDVGMTAVKVAAFGKAVNITLGLPFVRTSPDHGTAMDIAGRGVADPSSMREALAVAARLALRGQRETGTIVAGS